MPGMLARWSFAAAAMAATALVASAVGGAQRSSVRSSRPPLDPLCLSATTGLLRNGLVVAVAPPRSVLGRAHKMPVEHLRAEPLVGPPRGFLSRQLLEVACRGAASSPGWRRRA